VTKNLIGYIVLLLLMSCTFNPGCKKGMSVLNWHTRFGWKAEDYFDDPQVVALCNAIEANDLGQIQKLIDGGVNLNAIGKGKMTPLLWAYPDNQLPRFELLLQNGADPNVIITEDFGIRSALLPGMAVTHFACKTSFSGYFEAVFKHGGDPNLSTQTKALHSNETPIFLVIQGYGDRKLDKVLKLIKLGADRNHVAGSDLTPLMAAISRGCQFELANILLDNGADPHTYRPNSNQQAIHLLANKWKNRRGEWSNGQQAEFQKLRARLEKLGFSIEAALADYERWQSWSHFDGEYRRKMDAEIRERKKDEANKRAG